MKLALVLALLTACSSSKPSHHPTAMQEVLPPDPGPVQQLLVPENGVTTLLVGEGVALCTAEDPSLLEVWGTRERISIIGRKQGHTFLHVERPGKATEVVEVQIASPQPDAYALGVGAHLDLPSAGVKEWAESGPPIVEVQAVHNAMLGDAIVVTGLKPGTNIVLFINTDGTQRSVTFTVVEGDRQP